MIDRDDDMLHGYVLRTVQGIEAKARARALLRDLEGNALHECAEAAALGGDDVNAGDVCAARDLLELEPIPSYDDGGDTFDVADGLYDSIMFDDALEVYAEGRTTGDGSWDVQRVVVLLACGGPDIRLYWDGCAVYVEGRWGGSSCDMPVRDPVAVDAVQGALDHVWEGATA